MALNIASESKPERNERWKFALPGAVVLSFLLLPVPGKTFQTGDRQIHLNGQSLELTWDALTHSPQTITGVGSDLLEVKNIQKLTKREINDIGALLVSKYGFLLKVRPEHLLLRKAEKMAGSWHVSYQQTVRGLIVYDSSLGFSIDPEGRIKSLDAILYPNARAPVSAKIDRKQALKAARNCLKKEGKKEYRLQEESVAIYPERKAGNVDYRRVYIFNLFRRNLTPPVSPDGGYAVFVDAQTGKVVRTQALLMPTGSGPTVDRAPK